MAPVGVALAPVETVLAVGWMRRALVRSSGEGRASFNEGSRA